MTLESRMLLPFLLILQVRGWINLHNQKPQIFCHKKSMRLAGHEAYTGVMRSAHRMSVWILSGGSSWKVIRELKGGTEMDITEVGCDVDWIDLSRDRDHCCCHVNGVMTLQVAYKATNFMSSWRTDCLKKDSATWNWSVCGQFIHLSFRSTSCKALCKCSLSDFVHKRTY